MTMPLLQLDDVNSFTATAISCTASRSRWAGRVLTLLAAWRGQTTTLKSIIGIVRPRTGQ